MNHEWLPLAGTERARIEDLNWATAYFTSAVAKLDKTILLAVKDRRLWRTAADHENLITKRLAYWDPSNGPN